MRSRRLATLALALAAHLAPGSRVVAFRGSRSEGPALAPGAALPLALALRAALRFRSPFRAPEHAPAPILRAEPEPRVSVRVSRRAPMPPIRRAQGSGIIPGVAIALTLRRREARALAFAHAARRARGVALALAFAALAIAAQGCAPLAAQHGPAIARPRPCAEIMRRAGVSRPSALCGPATVRVAR